MTSSSPWATSSSSRLSAAFLSTDFFSLAAFGLVSLAVTSWERRRSSSSRAASRNKASSLHPFLPPETLVQYLHKNCGKRWSHYTEELEHFVRECPKVELHVHLDGSLDPDFLWQCMKQYDGLVMCLPVSARLPWDAKRSLPVRKLVQDCATVDAFHELCTCRRGKRSLQNMLTCFEIFLPLVRGAPLLLIEELAHDFCRRQWEQHVIYTEVRYSPHLLVRDDDNTKEEKSGSFDMGGEDDDDDGSQPHRQEERKQSARRVIEAVMRGLRRGCAEYDMVVNQILCGINWRPDWAMDIVELAREFQNDHPCGVVGVDIAAGEEHFDEEQFPHLYKKHFDMMQKAQSWNIPIAIHAGETPDGIHNVRRAVTTKSHEEPGYGAKRIGHGYRMTDSPALMQQLARQKIHVEICPTSSVETGGWMFDHAINKGTDRFHSSINSDDITSFKPTTKPWKEHPGLKMMRNGVSISLNSDDPAVFNTSLTWQYRIALAKMGLSQQEIAQTNIDAIIASFALPEEKLRIRKVLQGFFDSLANGTMDKRVLSDSQRFTDRVRDIKG